MAFLALVIGLAAGAGVVLWGQAGPAPSPTAPSPPIRADEHAVELVLFEAAPPRRRPRDAGPEFGPLHVDGATLLSGLVSSTVLRINNADDSLGVRAPALPVRVSPTARLQSVELKITVRDCRAASQWRPVDRPFTITWRDQYGQAHLDRAGDFDRSIARSLTRYIALVCGSRLNP